MFGANTLQARFRVNIQLEIESFSELRLIVHGHLCVENAAVNNRYIGATVFGHLIECLNGSDVSVVQYTLEWIHQSEFGFYVISTITHTLGGKSSSA